MDLINSEIRCFLDEFYDQPITIDTVLQYFCRPSNPFYDKTCVNEVAKMQKLTVDKWRQVDGIVFVVDNHASSVFDGIFVIRKLLQKDGKHVADLNLYYVMGRTVYQAPGLSSCVQTRMFNSLYKLNKAFHDVRQCAKYSNVYGKYIWDFKELLKETSSAAEQEANTSMNKFTNFEQIQKAPYPANLQYHFDQILYEMDKETIEQLNKKRLALEANQTINTTSPISLKTNTPAPTAAEDVLQPPAKKQRK